MSAGMPISTRDVIAALKADNSFRVRRLVALFPKKELRKGADGIVDLLLNLPAALHQAWRRVVAAMADWAPEMERDEPLNILRGLLQQGLTPGMVTLQAVCVGFCVLLRGEDCDLLQPVLSYLFNLVEVNLLNDWRLRGMMRLNRYPAQYRETGSPRMLQLLDLLQSHSPVLNSDLSDLMPWADFESMHLTLAGDLGDGRPL